MKNIVSIEFACNIKSAVDYINKNPEIKNYKVLFYDNGDYDETYIKLIEDCFKDNTSNVFISLVGNYSKITFDEYKETVIAINNKIKYIDKLNLSPIEKMMFIYDITRDRVYKDEEQQSKKINSRQLSTALTGETIVCVGFANIYQALLRKVGINSRLSLLYNDKKDKGHARVEAYVKDEKYDIDGVYYFDPTYDSRGKNNNNLFLYSYRHFALTKSQFDEIDDGRFVDQDFPKFSIYMDDELSEFFKDHEVYEIPSDMLMSINHMNKLVYNKSLVLEKMLRLKDAPKCFIPTKEKFYERLQELIYMYDQELPTSTLMEIVYNVRKIEYYLNPEKYDFSKVGFYNIFMNSNWTFDRTGLLKKLFKPESIKAQRTSDFLDYFDKNDLEKDIARVRVARSIRKICDKNVNKD